jgi:hypothetical protein
MPKPGRLVTKTDEPRPSKALSELKEALGLDKDDWKLFLGHARNGFSDYEQATFIDPHYELRLRDVPAKWIQDPDAIGYVFLRIQNRGKASLVIPVARHLLKICDPEPARHPVPPGTGLAWLHLARAGLAPPIEPARLTHFALDEHEDFYHGLAEDDVLPLARLILESRGTIEAWDLHAVIAAVAHAQIQVRAPFRLFHNLMAVDWIAKDVKRELCRGLLGCRREAERLHERSAAVIAAWKTDFEHKLKIPYIYLSLRNLGVDCRLPTLKRHAVYDLVEVMGEPLRDVIDEFFLKGKRYQTQAEAIDEGVLDLIGLHAEELGPELVRKLLAKATKRGFASVRLAAYRLGANKFGLNYARGTQG